MVTDIFAYAYVTAIVSCLHAYVISILWFYHESLRTNFCGFNIIIARNQNVDRRKQLIIQNTHFFKIHVQKNLMKS